MIKNTNCLLCAWRDRACADSCACNHRIRFRRQHKGGGRRRKRQRRHCRHDFGGGVPYDVVRGNGDFRVCDYRRVSAALYLIAYAAFYARIYSKGKCRVDFIAYGAVAFGIATAFIVVMTVIFPKPLRRAYHAVADLCRDGGLCSRRENIPLSLPQAKTSGQRTTKA